MKKKNNSGKFPLGTVALYGPNDKITTKIVAAVFKKEGAEPILEKWAGTKLKGDPKVADGIKAFFAVHGVKNLVMTSENMGCPHEEGLDFPSGEDCPFCRWWAGKQGSARKD